MAGPLGSGGAGTEPEAPWVLGVTALCKLRSSCSLRSGCPGRGGRPGVTAICQAPTSPAPRLRGLEHVVAGCSDWLRGGLSGVGRTPSTCGAGDHGPGQKGAGGQGWAESRG